MAINLQKGQKINFAKDNGETLVACNIGCGWDKLNVGDDVDLDASAMVFDGAGNQMYRVSWRQLAGAGIQLSGDNRTGAGDGYDEVIRVDLNAVPTGAERIVFVITSWKGHKFNLIKNAFCGITTAMETSQMIGKELFQINISEMPPVTALIMCSLYRHNGAWKLATHGEPCNGVDAESVLPDVRRVVFGIQA